MSEGAFFQDLAVLMAVVGLVTVVFGRLKWPKVIGYLVAGILMSKNTWGGSILVDEGSVTTIAQLGVVFLMFSLGLGFSASEMRKVRAVAIPTALLDVIVMTWLGYMVGTRFFGWGAVPSLFLGAAVCDSATTLLTKTIDEMHWMRRPFVKYIFGTTIFEDILCVGVIALITGVAKGEGMNVASMAASFGGLALFFLSVLVFGMLMVPRLLDYVGRSHDDETLLLTLLGCCFFVSFLAFKLDFSLALGAFLVGVLGSSSDVRSRLTRLVEPLQSMFAAMFFVSIGLLVDTTALMVHWAAILAVTALVLFGKGFNCFFASIVTGQSVKDAVQTGFGLAQIGEFAFMVAIMYMSLTKDATSPMFQIVVGASLLTTCLNPVMLRLSDPVGSWLENHVPVRVSGWMAAYSDWLERFLASQVNAGIRSRIRSRVIWIAVILALDFAVALIASMLNDLDWSRFSGFLNDHKRVIFCFAVNAFCVILLAPLAKVAHSLGRDVATAIVGIGRDRGWRTAVQGLIGFALRAAIVLAALAEIVAININLTTADRLTRIVIFSVIAIAAILGWRRFRNAGVEAGRRFASALAAEQRRSGDEKKPLSVPHDYYSDLTVPLGGTVAGSTIRELDIRAKTGATIVSIIRGEEKVRNPRADWKFEIGDVIVAIGEPEELAALAKLVKGDAQ